MKKLFLALTISITTFSSYAQFDFPNKKESAEFLARPLIVELKDEKHEGAFAKYYNQLVTENFQKYWGDGAVEFKTASEIDKLVKSDSKEFSVFHAGWNYKLQITGPQIRTNYEVFTFDGFLVEDSKKRNTDKERRGAVFSVSLPTNQIGAEDLVFVMKQFKIYLTTASVGGKKKEIIDVTTNMDIVSKKTLLVDKKSGISKKELSEYKNKANLADYSEIADAILNQDKDAAYVNLVWSDSHKFYMFVVSECETGRILSKMGTGGFNFNIISAPNTGVYKGYREGTKIWSYKTGQNLGMAHINLITSKFAQKFNNMLD